MMIMCVVSMLLFSTVAVAYRASDYTASYIEKYLHPMTKARTAVIISGQLRSGNISLASDMVYVYNKKKHFLSHSETRTPIETVIDRLISPLAIYGGVDLFIYLPVSINQTANKSWDGDPYTYEPSEGDRRVCELYYDRNIFDSRTGNKIFCMVESERELSDEFISQFLIWKNYYYDEPEAKEMFLQQEYGKYRANLGSKEYALFKGFNYEYKVRLRPDDAMVADLPQLESFNFRNISSYCPHTTIFSPNSSVFGYSGTDSFNIGLANDMDKLLDRYMDLITKPLHLKSSSLHNGRWSSEIDLRHRLFDIFGICLRPHKDILMTKIRRRDYSRPFNKLPKIDGSWIEL